MTANQETPKSVAAWYPFATRLAINAVSGAIAGLVIAACLMLAVLIIDHWDWQHDSLAAFLTYWSPLGGNFWYFVRRHSDAFIGGPFWGLIGGAITSLFFRRWRHPLALAAVWSSLWASFAITAALMMFFLDGMKLSRAHAADALGSVVVCWVSGAIYGFLLGLLARLMERKWIEKKDEPLASASSDSDDAID